MTKIQKGSSIGAWILFGIWDLVIGISSMNSDEKPLFQATELVSYSFPKSPVGLMATTIAMGAKRVK